MGLSQGTNELRVHSGWKVCEVLGEVLGKGGGGVR